MGCVGIISTHQDLLAIQKFFFSPLCKIRISAARGFGLLIGW